MLKKTRQILAVASILMVTLLFADFTGTASRWFGWMAKLQFLPAFMALNVAVIVGLVVLTLLFGRLYCSVICPLGIMQDGFAALGKKARKNRYGYSPARNILRYVMLGVMAVAMVAGVSAVVVVLAPYSAYGRIVSSFVSPLWIEGNNLLAGWAESHDSYAFYRVALKPFNIAVASVAALTLAALGVLAWRNGRTYCNTICPVGTVLGLLSRFSLFRPVIDTSKCNGCGLCARNCKSACINPKEHTIDYSRCVVCMDCLGKCRQGAISYTRRRKSAESAGSEVSAGRRRFIMVAGATAAGAALKAQEKTVDGGLAVIEDKKIPDRATPVIPPGAVSLRHLTQHCTACQLCVVSCPNGVLRPSTDASSFMQPRASYETGYCRPECTRCSNVCPAGAIRPVTAAEKSSIQVGHAVWVRENCLPLSEGVSCGNCARHCPVGAITMIPSDPADDSSVKIPAVNTERCIGCGACENLCPSRPFSAIYVEGHEVHRTI